jgi:hypothetical protein
LQVAVVNAVRLGFPEVSTESMLSIASAAEFARRYWDALMKKYPDRFKEADFSSVISGAHREFS